MKRSRYSATMSRCLGSSNQSRDRKRREGFASDAMGHNSLWKPRHVYAYTEQAASQRLCLPFRGAERDMRGGDVKGAKIVVAERCLRDRRAGQIQLRQQLAAR